MLEMTKNFLMCLKSTRSKYLKCDIDIKLKHLKTFLNIEFKIG